MDSSLKPEFWNKLNYLLTVGYKEDVIKSFKDYCLDEVFDEDSIIDDLDDVLDSSIIEHLQGIYNWNDKKLNDFFLKLRQALDIDPKPPKPKEEQKNHNNGFHRKPSNKPMPKPLYVSAHHIDYNLTQEELNDNKDIYFKQCARLLPLDQRTGDEALLRVLAIGRKNHTPLLQNIADTYSRIRINQYLNDKRSDLKESQFSLNYDYFKKLKRRNEKKNAEYLQSALQSFHKRICPKIQFTSLVKINDKIEDYFEYVSATIKFVHNVVEQQDALPPFQIDFWIIPKNVKSGMKFETDKFNEDISDSEEDPEDDDDDDDDEYDDAEHDLEITNTKLAEETIGDIEARLKTEDLTYDNHTVEYNSPQRNNNGGRRFERELDKKCKDFWRKRQDEIKKEFNRKYNEKYMEPDSTGAHKTRICIVIDRRKPKDDKDKDGSSMSMKNGHSSQNGKNNAPMKKTWDDRMYIYSPPNNCNTVDDEHVPESFFNASKECILPGKGYNNGKREEFEEKMKFNGNGNYNGENMTDLEVGLPIGGYQFTLSFHVESQDDIKAYMFYQGWIARFFPQDMIEIWPLWFDESKENKAFINNQKKWKPRMNELQKMLTDDQFQLW
eukprot:CAMPEP_0201582732 /NCGR_PEP_ID=MMETSP0190_2-20130828/89694_1 /ASSEMBLY_ACC=CAM_ASM_000263 /TAXON_ID=37353 /ORGANISM="Rosalina sp." /LENGTH=608 /DNA_ID=CAMNT_0048023275 /DNA_START=18 /DNA_END=1841 /DNA_ORIENTATION=-